MTRLRLAAFALLALLLAAGCTSPGERLSTASVGDDAAGSNETPDAAATPSPESSPEPAISASAERDNGTTTTAAPAFALSGLSTSGATAEAGGAGVVVRGLASGATRAQAIRVRAGLAGAPAVTAVHLVSGDDLLRTSEPTGFGDDGCRAWRVDDATLGFACQVKPPRGAPEGDYEIDVDLTGTGGAAGGSAGSVHVSPMTLVQVASAPVDASGQPIQSSSWGGWDAQPGASSVAATNYVKLTNAGDNPRARVVVDLGTGGFRGAQDPRYVVPTVDNVEWAWWEVNATALPPSGPVSWHAGAGRTSDTVQFTATGNVIYVAYRIKAMPSVLPAQAYLASYTVTET